MRETSSTYLEARIRQRIVVTMLMVSAMYALPAVAQKSDRDSARARELFAKAVQLGSKNLVVAAIVKNIPADDGEDAVFSANKDVDAAMKKGEAAYGSRDYRKR